MTRLPITAMFAVALLCTACAAPAQQRGQRGQLKQCADDVRRLCPGIERGDGRLAQCMREQIDQVSPQCRDQLQSAAQRMQQQRGTSEAPPPPPADDNVP